ncbi:MAG: ribosome-associated translation inhibitor RaiA, partial [FCB group bacterium]|nr:ribosome-associated translation inhibitor RaiA [FCB group bacterium]
NLREYAENEVQKIKKVFDRATQCQVILIQEKQGFTTELNVSIPNRKLNVKETTDNVTKSIDRAVDTMIQRVTKIKGKRNRF